MRKSFGIIKSIEQNGILKCSQNKYLLIIDIDFTTPKQTKSSRKSLRGPSGPIARSASPKKTGISGTARRSNGVDILKINQNVQKFDPEDRENVALTPTKSTHTIRHFSPSPEKPALRDITVDNAINTTGNGIQNEALPNSILAPRFEIDEEDVSQDVVGTEYPTPTPVDNSYIPVMEDEYLDLYNGNEIEMEESDALREPLPQPFDDEEADQTFEPESRNLPAEANSRRKRRSENFDDFDAQPAKRSKKADSFKNQDNEQSKRRGRPPLTSKHPNLKMSSRQEKELEEIVERVRARPGAAKSLYILRRETPADDGITHTRSGRISVKPLAYWRNERCIYGGSPGGPNIQDGARFPLNSIKEIIRTEEVNAMPAKKPRKKSAQPRSRKSTNDKDSENASDSDNMPVDADADPWENEIGTFRGLVSVWDADEQAPLEQEEEIDLAYAPAAIDTREVKSSTFDDGPTFRFAKLLSTKFFGTGIVEIPPGGIKRPKNSRKMHMSFFVFEGRVTVQVGPVGGEDTGSTSRFSIGKGGFWQVPRGKSTRLLFGRVCH